VTVQSSSNSTARVGFSSNDLKMLLVMFIWGANFAIVKSALDVLPPLVFVALRFGLGTIILMAILLWMEGWPQLSKQDWIKLIGLGLIGNTLYQPFFTMSLNYTSAANSALILASVPLFVAIVNAIMGTERINRSLAAGIGLAMVGMALVLTASGLSLGGETLFGDFLCFIAMIAWSIYTIGLRTVKNLTNLQVSALTMLTGAPGLVLLGLPEMATLDWSQVGIGAWGALIYSTLFAICVAYLVWNNSVRVAGATRTAVYQCLTPLIATAVAWYLLNEPFTLIQGIGGVLIIVGLLLSTLRGRSKA
jgi:drug/metabolite transporter (DMT)-like permease